MATKTETQIILFGMKCLGGLVSVFGIVIISMVGWFLTDMNGSIKEVKKDVTTLKAQYMSLDNWKGVMDVRVFKLEDRR